MYQHVSLGVLLPTELSEKTRNGYVGFELPLNYPQWITSISRIEVQLVLLSKQRNPNLRKFKAVQQRSADPNFTVRFPIRAPNPFVLFPNTKWPPKSLSTKTLNFFIMFWTSGPQCSFRFSNRRLRCTLQWNEVEFTKFTCSLVQTFRCFYTM